MHGNYEVITKVGSMLTAPSQLIMQLKIHKAAF
jgi:hypothetical protein